MNTWERNSTHSILKSLESELAKARHELNCIQGDAEKVSNRVAFCLSAIHNIKNDN